MDTNESSNSNDQSIIKRKRVTPKSSVEEPEKCKKWNGNEKKRLLTAVKAVGFDDLNELANRLKSKDQDQISAYLRSREVFGRKLIKEKKNQSGSDFETWFNTVSLLMAKQKDFSQIIGDVIGLLATNETQTKSKKKKKRNGNQGHDVFEFYRYLQSLFNQEISPLMTADNQKKLSYLIDMLWRIVEAVEPDLDQEADILKKILHELSSKPKFDSCDLKLSLNPVSIPEDTLKQIYKKLVTNPVFIQEIEAFVYMCLST